MAIGAVVARILTQYSDKGSKAAQKDIAKLGKKFDDFAKRTTKAFGVAAAAVGAFAIKVGKDAVQAAIADQKSQVLLANALRNTTGATNAAIEAVDQYIGKLQFQVGVADDELRPALARLAAVTGDVATAQDILSTALDVSAFAGVDLNTATTALIRGFQGSFRSLQKLVPTLDIATVKSKNFSKIFNEVQKATQGAAGSRANTAEYQLKILQLRYEDILETLGYALLPVIKEFANTIQKDVLPQLERWIAANKVGLVDGFKKAAKAGVEIAKAIIMVGQAIVDNIETIILLAKLFAVIWATKRVYDFAKAVAAVSLAFNGMQTAAAGAAIASAAATGAGSATAAKGIMSVGTKTGIFGTLIATLIAGLTFGLGKIDLPGTRTRANRLSAEREASFAGASKKYGGAPGPSDLASMLMQPPSTQDDSYQKYLDFLKKMQKLEKDSRKNSEEKLSTEAKIIQAKLKAMGVTLMTAKIEKEATLFAVKKNLEKQAKLGLASPTISLLASANAADQATLNANGNGSPVVNVNISTPYGTKDDFMIEVESGLNTLQRRRGRGAGGGFFLRAE